MLESICHCISLCPVIYRLHQRVLYLEIIWEIEAH